MINYEVQILDLASERVASRFFPTFADAELVMCSLVGEQTGLRGRIVKIETVTTRKVVATATNHGRTDQEIVSTLLTNRTSEVG